MAIKILFRAYFHQKNFQKKVGRKFIRVRIRIRIRTFLKVGSGSGSGQNRPDPQHCLQATCISCGLKSKLGFVSESFVAETLVNSMFIRVDNYSRVNWDFKCLWIRTLVRPLIRLHGFYSICSSVYKKALLPPMSRVNPSALLSSLSILILSLPVKEKNIFQKIE
jgi:hypothetical protein